MTSALLTTKKRRWERRAASCGLMAFSLREFINVFNTHTRTIPNISRSLVFSDVSSNMFNEYFLGLLLFDIPISSRSLRRIYLNILKVLFAYDLSTQRASIDIERRHRSP